MLDEPDLPGAVAERDQFLAEQQDAHGVAVATWKLARKEHRHPVFAHESAHWRTGSDAADSLVVAFVQHNAPL